MMELTVDKCVLVHCDSKAEDAQQYREKSLAFLEHWKTNTQLVACRNPGIAKEFSAMPPAGAEWWRSVVGQSRYRDKKRVIRKPQRDDFRNRANVPLHGEDFDYVDAASQSDSLLWLSNEATWQNTAYRQRIQAQYRVQIQNVNEYL
jgi:hypothetical protein